ncbi:MAG: Spy/CpxP family protein refolding chaperone [Bermanella sp.]|jgi:Spy/CpxP family protein refolding chaperone
MKHVMQHRNLLVVAALVLFASDTFAKPFGGAGHHRGQGREQVMEQLEVLELSQEKKSAIGELFQASKSARKTLSGEKHKLFKQLHAQDADSLTPAQIDKMSAEFGRISAQGMRQRLEVKAALAQILTPQQRQQWQQHRKERREQWHKQRTEEASDDL